MTIKNLPTTYAEALERLAGKDRRTIANNTVLERHTVWSRVTPAFSAVSLLLHGHAIVTFYEDGEIVLRDCGWQTVTTKQRLNVVARAHGLNIVQQDYHWRIVHTGRDGFRGGEDWDGSYTIPAPKADLIGTRCECGAPYDELRRGYACAV